MMMIKERLIAIEKDVQTRIFVEQQNLEAIAMVKELMDQIDHEVEEVPLTDKTRLSKLLVSLKGAELDEAENRLLERIIIR
jgi:hypothetical protein